MTDKPSPQLLVSVRNADEAAAALAGGCDILDVKEPNHGSLGMADVNAIRNVIHATQKITHRKIPVSAALGETTEWINSAEIPALPKDLEFVKLGLSGMHQQVNWDSHWNTVREQFEKQAGTTFRWIAVIYADRELADSPEPHAIIDAAIETKCAGVLFDTFSKTGKSLLDWINPTDLEAMISRIRSADLKVAVAGSLQMDTLPEILPLRPDIVAIRGAACPQGDRKSGIDSQRVQTFQNALNGTPETAISS